MWDGDKEQRSKQEVTIIRQSSTKNMNGTKPLIVEVSFCLLQTATFIYGHMSQDLLPLELIVGTLNTMQTLFSRPSGNGSVTEARRDKRQEETSPVLGFYN